MQQVEQQDQVMCVSFANAMTCDKYSEGNKEMASWLRHGRRRRTLFSLRSSLIKGKNGYNDGGGGDSGGDDDDDDDDNPVWSENKSRDEQDRDDDGDGHLLLALYMHCR